MDWLPTTSLQYPLEKSLLASSVQLTPQDLSGRLSPSSIQPLTFYLSPHQRVTHMGRGSVPPSHGLFKHQEGAGLSCLWHQKRLSPDHISLCICSKAGLGVWIGIRGALAHLRPVPSTPEVCPSLPQAIIGQELQTRAPCASDY